jgi:hypothetical protein
MIKLEELQQQMAVKGIMPDSSVTVVNIHWIGSNSIELTYKPPAGKVANALLFRHERTGWRCRPGAAWSFDGEGPLFRMVAGRTESGWPTVRSASLRAYRH